MKIVITSLFGLESLVKEDLIAIGYTKEQITVKDAAITLEVPDSNWTSDLARVNMWTRRGERVFFEVGSFRADTFEDYFDGFSRIEWNEYIPKDFAFIVNGFSRKSKIYGISACQSLAKKAISKSLINARHLPENATINEDRDVGEIKIQFGIVNDVVQVMIDTSGAGLHKRGYRPLTHEAPIKETLASGMVSLAHYKPFGYEALVDPFCGSGTIVIEACMMALNIAPGKNRHFAFENIPYIGTAPYIQAREEALDEEDLTPLDDTFYFGSDIDKNAVYNARINAEKAGVANFIKFKVADAKDMTPQALASYTGFDRQLVITNPPYGGRLLSEDEAFDIYKLISRTYLTSKGTCKKGIRLSVISPDDTFEYANGIKADKRIKLYNGNIKCQLNNFFRMDKSVN